MNTDKQRAAAAKTFVKRWQGRGYEKGESQTFWLELLGEVFGVENPGEYIRFEEHVKVDTTNFIDGHIASTKVLIEQKSIDKDLRKGILQSDGSVINPFLQARRYVLGMPVSQHPRWIVTCNFREFLVYDMEQPNGEPESILLENLGCESYRLQFLIDQKSEHIRREMQVSMQAGEIVGRIYDALLKQYGDTSPQTLRWLNILCVRIVFCLYAEDACVFNHDQFHNYLADTPAEDVRSALLRLFETLNTPIDKRSPYLKESLKVFPYTNGGLFAEEIEVPQFTPELKDILLQNASLNFDWSEISPTIFGAVFESTLNPDTRRSGGMHYTSIENIHKVIDPLFLNDLRHELDTILEERSEKKRNVRLEAFQDKLAQLTFLDPACGSGNFLTETYLSLRRLENEAIRERYHGQMIMGAVHNPVKVSINQFHGIEINDFAVTVATTALWISEAQMLAETEKIVQHNIDFLPLRSYTNIREGNALQMDWDTIECSTGIPTIHAKNTYLVMEDKTPVASEPTFAYNEINLVTSHISHGPKPSEVTTHKIHYDYIMGNPPFQGYSLQSKKQKEDMLAVYVDEKGKPYKMAGKIDYVACWYMKVAQSMSLSPDTKAAFVSTNSICQGEQVSAVWRPLLERYGMQIDFAYRTFRWDSESNEKAHVHCVIVGFSKKNDASQEKRHTIYDGDGVIQASHINPYLMDAPDIWVESRNRALSDVPPMVYGNKPTDGGNLMLSQKERDDLYTKWAYAAKYIRRFVGADEYINNKPRYCLWLKGANPTELRQSPEVMRRIEGVRLMRLASTKEATRFCADTPTLFQEDRQPTTNYIIVPCHSSENRHYIPIGFVLPDIICGNANFLIPNASLFHFGVLMSNVHMAWMRAVCGRLKSDYRYSKDIVYNNFPWPTPTAVQRKKIEQAAQAILDARALYPDSSLADLYDDLTMPPKLRQAHQDNDHAVMQAYGFDVKTTTETTCVAKLFQLYQQLTNH